MCSVTLLNSMELIFILSLTFFLRLIFIFARNTDDYVHFWNIRLLKETKGNWKKKAPNSVIEGWRGYPVLHHKVISLFPEKHWDVAGKTLNILYDCLSILFLYFIAEFLLLKNNIPLKSDNAFSYQGLICLVTATTPILSPFTSRIRTIGARTMGSFLSLIYFSLLAGVVVYQIHILLLFCVLIGIIIFSSLSFFYCHKHLKNDQYI